MDSFAGMRKMQTLRKLPIAAPNIKAKIFKIMASSLLNFYKFFGELCTTAFLCHSRESGNPDINMTTGSPLSRGQRLDAGLPDCVIIPVRHYETPLRRRGNLMNT